MPKTTTLTIDTENPKKSYSLKGINKVVLTNQYNNWGTGELEDMITNVAFSGKNMVLTMADEQSSKLTFSGVTSLDDIVVEYMNGDTIKTNGAGVLRDVLNAKMANAPITEPIKGTKITGSFLNDVVDLTEFRLKDKSGNDIVDSTKKGLTVDGGLGNDTIRGSIYKDTLKGGDGNDTFLSSAGSDTYTGGKGISTFIYNTPNFGDDVINTTKGETVNINFNAGFNPTFSQGKNKNDLLIRTTQGTVTIKNCLGKNNNAVINIDGTNLQNIVMSEVNATNYFEANPKKMNTKYTGTGLSDVVDASDLSKPSNVKKNTGVTIDGGDGNDLVIGSDYNDTIKAGTGIADFITGGQGDDTLYASTTANSNTTFIFNNGDGNDIVNSGKGEDTLRLNNVLLGDVEFTVKKSDLVIGYNHNDENVAQDSITLKNYFKKNAVISSVKNIEIAGQTFGIEELRELKEQYNVISGNNSIMNGSSRDDLIIASNTDGYQTVYAKDGNDIIYAGEGSYSKIVLGEEGDDTIYGSGLDREQGVDNYHAGSGNNTIYAGEGGPVKHIYLGNGNDTIFGSSDAQNYLYLDSDFAEGGNATLYWNGSSNTRLNLNHFNKEDIIFTRANSNDDLVLRYGNNKSITLKNYYKAGNEAMATHISAFNTAMGTLIEERGGVKLFVEGVTGTDGNDYIVGTNNAETITGGAGNDFIDPLGGNDTINLGTGDDILKAGEGNKTITAVSGNNSIELGNGNNTVYAGTGNDNIKSGTGNNRIEFLAGDTKNDVFTHANGNDTLVFKGDTLSDLSFDRTYEDDYISIGRSNESLVTVYNVYDWASENFTIEDKNGATSNLLNLNTIAGDDSREDNQYIETGSGNDHIYTGYGNDEIVPGTGNNTIYLQTVNSENNNTYSFENGTDKFVLSDMEDFDNLNLLRSENDLIVAYNGDFYNDTLRISDFYENESMKNSISFEAGETTATLAELIEEKGVGSIISCDGSHIINQSGAAKGVTIMGCEEADQITGSNFADVINGGNGADTLIGGAGNDTYVINSDDWAENQKVINDSSGTADALRIDANQAHFNLFFDVTLTKDGGGDVVMDKMNAAYTTGNDLFINGYSDYEINNAKTSNGVKITNYFTTGEIENIMLQNGNTTIDPLVTKQIPAIGQAVANWLNQNGFDSTTQAIANGTAEQKAQLKNLYLPIVSQEYKVYGTLGDNLIIADRQDGYQYVYARSGNDIIYAPNNNYAAYIYAEEGDDIIYGSNVWKENAQDMYYTGSGNNTVYAGDGGMKRITLGEGNDTVYTSSTVSNYLYLSGYNDTMKGGEDTIYWQGSNNVQLYIDTSKYKDIYLTRTGAENDLAVRYGNDSTVMLKDFYKAGNETMGDIFSIRADEYKGINEAIADKGVRTYIKGSGVINNTSAGNAYMQGSDGADTINGLNNDVLNGGAGNDTYYSSALNKSTVIVDSEGNDTLHIANTSSNIHVLFNVDQDGSFSFGNDFLYLVDETASNTWFTTSNFPTNGVKITGFNSIETIESSDGKQLSNLDQLRENVATWLSDANDGNGYASVADAITSGNDMTELVAIFDSANWTPAG